VYLPSLLALWTDCLIGLHATGGRGQEGVVAMVIHRLLQGVRMDPGLARALCEQARLYSCLL